MAARESLINLVARARAPPSFVSFFTFRVGYDGMLRARMQGYRLLKDILIRTAIYFLFREFVALRAKNVI